jgi:hypothetical protein
MYIGATVVGRLPLKLKLGQPTPICSETGWLNVSGTRVLLTDSFCLFVA